MLKPFESVSNNPSVYSVDSMLQVRLKITDRLHSTVNYRRNDIIPITTGTQMGNRGAFQITDFDKINFSDILSHDIPKTILMAGRHTCLRKIEMHPAWRNIRINTNFILISLSPLKQDVFASIKIDT